MIYVICNNDSMELATKDKKTAEVSLSALKEKSYQEKLSYGSRISREAFFHSQYFHIHEVKEIE